MPKVTSKPPEGYEIVEETLSELNRRMREAETENTEQKRRRETHWNIFRLHHQRSRYIYEMYYKRQAIDKKVYDYCVKKYGDKNLIAKWRKPGYEKLCCLRCIQPRDTNFGTACICRVPQGHLKDGKTVECLHCGYCC